MSATPDRLSIRTAFPAIFAFIVAAALPVQGATDSNTPEQLTQWYRAHTIPHYFKGGHASVEWDQAATNALDLFARRAASKDHQTPANYRALCLSLSNAVVSGCKDPLVEWLDHFYGATATEQTPEKLFRQAVQTAGRLEKTKYTTAFKYHAQARIWYLWGWHFAQRQAEFPEFKKQASTAYSTAYWLGTKITKETNTPIEVIYECIDELARLNAGDSNGLPRLYSDVSSNLTKYWPGSAYTALFRGSYYVDYSSLGRGTATADKVPAENWKLYFERKELAREWLNKAWQIDPTLRRIPLDMLRVQMGSLNSRAQMELWFHRAMDQDTNNFDACDLKVHYLVPQWHGSAREMLEFGRQCVASTAWGNEVPLTLVRAYERLYDYTWNEEGRKGYWTRPAVWKDMQLACDKYLRTDIHGPNHARHKYIWVARRCEQWSFIEEQLPLLTSTNYDYFGGRAAFDEMAQTAARQAKKDR